MVLKLTLVFPGRQVEKACFPIEKPTAYITLPCATALACDTNYKPSLLLNNVCLAVVDEVKDLGVVIDSRLTFHTHIKQNVVRASIRANLLHECFYFTRYFYSNTCV